MCVRNQHDRQSPRCNDAERASGHGQGRRPDRTRELLHKHRIERVLIVDDNSALKGMMTVNDIEKSQKLTRCASKDDQRSSAR